jgi:hypothetical protein
MKGISHLISILHLCYMPLMMSLDQFREEVNSTNGRLWKEAMVDEMESSHKNETWDLVELPNGRKPISIKWVFKKMLNMTIQVDKYKARLVAKGYS